MTIVTIQKTTKIVPVLVLEQKNDQLQHAAVLQSLHLVLSLPPYPSSLPSCLPTVYKLQLFRFSKEKAEIYYQRHYNENMGYDIIIITESSSFQKGKHLFPYTTSSAPTQLSTAMFPKGHTN